VPSEGEGRERERALIDESMSATFHSKYDMKIYLDVCCLNRPFDDQAQDRVHMEAEAVAAILGHVDRGGWTWIASEAVLVEIHRMTDEARKLKVLKLVAGVSRIASISPEIVARSRDLAALGFTAMDALHVACAESTRVDVFLTTDDRLERLAQRHRGALQVRIANPWQWLEEVAAYEG
jgi:predicted nucleic acid-binding protein